MAKQPKFYPNLPRDKSRKLKSDRRVGAILVNQPYRVPRVMRADRYYIPFPWYEPNYISETTTELVGNDIRSGTKNPNWRVTIAQGGDATSNYSREHFHAVPTTYSVVSEGNNYISKGYGTRWGGLLKQENDTVAIDDIAIGRLKHKLQDKVGNVRLAPPLAESREIGRLVRQINGLGMDAFKALLAAKKTKGKSVAKQLSDIWLGFGFGVNPLLQDIKSSADSILHYVTRTDHRVVVTGAARQEHTSGYRAIDSSEYVAYGAAIMWHLNAHHIQSVRYVAGVDLTVKSSANYSVANHLGLELGALPSALWELTAFSWVVDYFTTVGSYLDDVFYTLPGTVKYISKSYKYQSRTFGFPCAAPSDNFKITLNGSVSKTIYTLFVRTKLAPTLPTRSLRIKSVDEIASHGLTKFLNLASVLVARRGPKL